MADPGASGAPAGREDRDPRALWRTAFSVLLAASAYVLLSPASRVPSHVPVPDKVVHGGLFALLAVTGVLAGLGVRALLVALLCWAAGSELLQAVLPIGRDADVRDLAADAAGIAVGLAAVLLVRPPGPG